MRPSSNSIQALENERCQLASSKEKRPTSPFSIESFLQSAPLYDRLLVEAAWRFPVEQDAGRDSLKERAPSIMDQTPDLVSCSFSRAIARSAINPASRRH